MGDWTYSGGSPNLGRTGVEPVRAPDVDIGGLDIPGIDGEYSIGCHEQQYRFSQGDPNVSTGDGRFIFHHMMPNWRYSVRLSYGFQTPISLTRRKYEQRKSLYQTPIRIHSYSITTENDYSLIWNYLIYLHARSLLSPIYIEPVIPTGNDNMRGQSVVYVGDVSYYYNLNNLCNIVVLVDLRDIVIPEMLFLSSVDQYSINLSTPVVGNFMKKFTVIFPVFECYMSSKRRSDVTDRMTKFDIEMMEWK